MNESLVYSAMMNEIEELEGDTNCRSLAENAAHLFNHDEWLDNELHAVWEIAQRVYSNFREENGLSQ